MERTVTQRISLGDIGGVLCNGESDDPKFNGNGESRRNDDGGGSRRHRISYDKEFLMECSNSPIAKRKPADFPLPDLGCTLSAIKSTRATSAAHAFPPYLPPRRKEEIGGRGGDNISLRPHSGNFAGGCSPVFTSHSYGSREKELANSELQKIVDGHFRDQNRSPNQNQRFPNPNKRFDFNSRPGPERDRDPREYRGDNNGRGHNRDHRDIDNERGGGGYDRERGRREWDTRDKDGDRESKENRFYDRNREGGGGGGYRDRDRHYRDERDVERDRRGDRPNRNSRPEDPRFHISNRWGDADGGWDDSHHEGGAGSKWNQNPMKNGRGDGPNGSGHFERKDHQHGHRDYKQREEREPEWFSGGPTSRHETMELRGFMDDDRRDKADDSPGKDKSRRNETLVHDANADDNEEEPTGELNLSIEKILKMDSIPGLENGLEAEKPKGVSRYSHIFGRSSAITQSSPPRQEQESHAPIKLQTVHPSAPSNTTHSTGETDDKKEITLELGNALRRILQINPNLGKTAKDEGKPLVQGPVVAVVSSAPSSVPMSMPKRAPPLPVPSYCLVDQPPFIFNSNWGMPPPPHPGMMPPQQTHPGMMPSQQTHPGMMPPQQTHPGMMLHQALPQGHGGRQGGGRQEYRDDDRDQQRQQRIGTPVSCNAMFTPTSVMRKMTGDSPKPSNSNRRTPVGLQMPLEPNSADFNMIVQQLTGQSGSGPRLGMAPVPQMPQMHAAQYQLIHPVGQIMLPQHQQQQRGPSQQQPMMMNPFPFSHQSYSRSGMNFPQHPPRHDMPPS